MSRTVLAGCAPSVLIALDFAILSVAAPAVARDLEVPARSAAWAFSAYNLVFGALLLAVGGVAARRRRRLALVPGLAGFAAGAILAATAGSLPALVAARCLQGAGAALMTPAALSLLTTATPPGPLRERALRRYGLAISGGFVAGTLAGGTLTAALGWRAAVAATLPLTLAALGVAATLQPAAHGERAATTRPPGEPRTAVLAVALLAVGAGAAAGGPGGAAVAMLAAMLAAVALARVARVPRLRLASAAGAVVTGTGVTGTLLLTLQLQGVRGLTPPATGALFACFGLAAVPGAWLASRTSARFRPGGVLSTGLAAQGAGLLAAGMAAARGGLALLGVALALFGLGHVMGNVGSATVATESAPAASQGEAAGVLATAQYLGGALGPAILAGAVTATAEVFLSAIVAAGGTALAAAVAVLLIKD